MDERENHAESKSRRRNSSDEAQLSTLANEGDKKSGVSKLLWVVLEQLLEEVA